MDKNLSRVEIAKAMRALIEAALDNKIRQGTGKAFIDAVRMIVDRGGKVAGGFDMTMLELNRVKAIEQMATCRTKDDAIKILIGTLGAPADRQGDLVCASEILLRPITALKLELGRLEKENGDHGPRIRSIDTALKQGQIGHAALNIQDAINEFFADIPQATVKMQGQSYRNKSGDDGAAKTALEYMLGGFGQADAVQFLLSDVMGLKPAQVERAIAAL